MPKQTRKYSTAVQLALKQHITEIDNQEKLYRLLNEAGHYWDGGTQAWQQITEDADPPTELIRVRVWAESSKVGGAAYQLRVAMEETGYQFLEQSEPYPCNTMELPSGGDRPKMGEFNLGPFSEWEDLNQERQFTNTLDSLILQTMLYMQTPQQKAQLIPTQPTANHQTRGFDPHSPQEPIWIGSDFQQRTINKPHQGGAHASPTTHWRRGHWRFIPAADSGTTKPIWIRPTIVNG